MKIEIQKALESDLTWINQKYDEVEFQHSDLNNEIIAIAKANGEKAGLGRLVKINEDTAELGGMYVFEMFQGQGIASEIIKFLLSHANQFKYIYCLPFEELNSFYCKYGFQVKTEKNGVPEAVLKKHQWCNKKYNKKVSLLYLETFN